MEKGKNNIQEKTWNEIGDKIFDSSMKLVKLQIRDTIRKKVMNAAKMLAAFFISIVGAIYLLTGIAILINEFFGVGDFAGYILVGLALLITAMVVYDKRKR